MLSESRKSHFKTFLYQSKHRMLRNDEELYRLTGREVKKERKKTEDKKGVWSQVGLQRSLERTTGCLHPREVVLSLCLTLCDPMDCITPGFPVLPYLPEFAQTYVYWLSSNHLIVCCPLLLSSILPSDKVVSNESAVSIRCPKYWSFHANTSVQVFQHQSFQ